MVYKYATQNMTDKCAKAVKVSAQVSRKQSIEMAKWLVGREPQKALALLSRVPGQEIAMPATRFNRHIAHKRNIGPGSFPIKTTGIFVELINSVLNNAENKSLNASQLIIKNIVVQKGPKTYKPSRIRGLQSKNTHVEIVVEEVVASKKLPRPQKKSTTTTKVTGEQA